MFDTEVILCGEIWRYSILGIKWRFNEVSLTITKATALLTPRLHVLIITVPTLFPVETSWIFVQLIFGANWKFKYSVILLSQNLIRPIKMVQNIPHFRNTGRDYNGTTFKTTRNFTGWLENRNGHENYSVRDSLKKLYGESYSCICLVYFPLTCSFYNLFSVHPWPRGAIATSLECDQKQAKK